MKKRAWKFLQYEGSKTPADSENESSLWFVQCLHQFLSFFYDAAFGPLTTR